MWSWIKEKLHAFWTRFREEGSLLWRLTFSIFVGVLLGRLFTTLTGMGDDFGNVTIFSFVGAVLGGVFYAGRTLRKSRQVEYTTVEEDFEAQ